MPQLHACRGHKRPHLCDAHQLPCALPPPAGLVTEVDGLKLHLSKRNKTGYLCVAFNKTGDRFRVEIAGVGQIGVFDTAVEAAVAYARRVQSLKVPEEAGETAERAAQAAAAAAHPLEKQPTTQTALDGFLV